MSRAVLLSVTRAGACTQPALESTPSLDHWGLCPPGPRFVLENSDSPEEQRVSRNYAPAVSDSLTTAKLKSEHPPAMWSVHVSTYRPRGLRTRHERAPNLATLAAH
jgi:hypothetical protein